MEVDFWVVKSSGCEKSLATEVKCSNIPQKSKFRRKSKVFRLPFQISQQKRLFDQSSFTIQMSLGVFQNKIAHGNESCKILLRRLFRFIFGMKFYLPNNVDLLDKLKEVKKFQFFSTVGYFKNMHRIGCVHVSCSHSDG
jgi:hypothetical protein